jgi:hypothetical protein
VPRESGAVLLIATSDVAEEAASSPRIDIRREAKILAAHVE